LRYLFWKIALFPVLSFFSPSEVEGLDNLRDVNMPCIFVFNHTSHFDVPLIYKILPRNIKLKTATGAARDYWFENNILAKLIALNFNAFPIVRDGPIKSSIEYMGNLLDEDWSLILSPEGTRSLTGKISEFKKGAGFIAVNMKVPVIPIKIDGLYKVLPKGRFFPKRSRVKVIIGKTLDFSKVKDYQEATLEIKEAITSL
jgi:long-chain acyl-CoA synthetase